MDALSTTRSSFVDVNATGNPDTSCVNALPAGTRLKNFEVVSTLGQGGFSIVYAAMDTALQRPVAVKEYMPSTFASRTDSSRVILKSQRHKSSFEAGLNSFIEEARLLAQFKHPALVEVLSFWEENGTAYMAMPLYSGKTMRQTLRDNSGHANERWLKQLIAPVLDVLELLHDHQIYHRDIAPDNIILKQDGLPVLLDLGSARKVATDSEHAPTVVVKPGYAPIEQYAEDKSVPQGPWTDIYALGALLYYVVTGRPPAASVSRMMKDSLAPLSGQNLPGYSQEFLAAIDAALALQPADRPQSISEFSDLLDINNLSMPTTGADTAGDSPDYLDEEKTVILSAADLEQLLRGDGVPQTQATPSDDLDVFKPQPQPAQDSHSFADMAEFLNPPTAQTLGTVSVPRGQRTNPTELDTAKPGAVKTPAHTRNRLFWAVGIGGGLVAAGVLIAVLLTGQSEEALPSGELAESELAAPPLLAVESESGTDDEALILAEPVDVDELDYLREMQPPAGSLTPDSYVMDSGSKSEFMDEQQSVLTDKTGPAQAGQEVVLPPPVKVVAVDTAASTNQSPQEQRSPAVAPARSTPENRSQARQAVSRATPPSSKAAETGTIELSILPWGEIWVDGKKMGVTPPIRELQLPVGRRDIEIRNPGFSSLTHIIEITPHAKPVLAHEFITGGSSRADSFDEPGNQQPTIAQPLERAPIAKPEASPQPTGGSSATSTEYGYADIRLRPWGEVWVDGEKKGIAPPLNELKLSEGIHTIEFRNPNYPSVKRTVEISSAARSTLIQNFD